MKKTIHIISSVIIILLLSACVPSVFITIKSGEIPPQMEAEDFSLIVILPEEENYHKKMRRKLLSYSGKYILVSKRDMLGKTYDKDEYRFLLDNRIQKVQFDHMSSPNDIFMYFLKDRKTGESFNRLSGSSHFGHNLKSYLKAIDQVRRK